QPVALRVHRPTLSAGDLESGRRRPSQRTGRSSRPGVESVGRGRRNPDLPANGEDVMRLRLCALAAAGGAVLTMLPAHAATAKPQITDPTGDANAINGQGETTSVPSQSTPADASFADIVSVRFATTFATKVVKHKKTKVATGM